METHRCRQKRDGYELPSGVLILTNLCLKFDRLIITSVLFKTKNKGKNASFSKLGLILVPFPDFNTFTSR